MLKRMLATGALVAAAFAIGGPVQAHDDGSACPAEEGGVFIGGVTSPEGQCRWDNHPFYGHAHCATFVEAVGDRSGPTPIVVTRCQ